MAVLLATCISTLVVNANTSAVSILLPAISDDTGTSIETLQWAVTGYSLVGAAVIVTAGALGDVFGRRKLFLLGIALFIVSCVLIALSPGGGGVIAGRAIQGASGATILASGLSLLSVASSGSEQMRVVSIWGAASAVGAAAGPLVGGLLVDSVGWQGLFWLDAAIAAACIPITLRGIQESNDPSRSRSIDYVGTLLVAGILTPVIFGMTKATDWGWISVATLAMFGLAAAAAFAFVWVERRVKAPLVDLALLRNRVLVGATLAILIGAGTINAMAYLLSIYFQNPEALDFSPLAAGLATLPATVGLVAVTPFVPRLAVQLGT
ncbi:MAG: MFS transporter, partial [Candidatus Limnocylindria bacterium]